MDDSRLHLLAQAADEVPLLSALSQSAVLRASDVAYDRQARRLVLLLARYRWETRDATRIRTALRIDSVLSVQQRGWPDADPHDPGTTMLELLAFTLADDVLTLAFAGGASLRVAVECPDLVLEDLSAPWAAGREPRYD